MREIMNHRKTLGVFAGAAVATAMSLASPAGAQADFTHFNKPAPGEPGHINVLSQYYGGTFHANGWNLTNGTITARRIDDSEDQMFSAANGFTSNLIDVNAEMAQVFGYFNGENGTSRAQDFNKVFHVKGKSGQVTQDQGEQNPQGEFRFSRGGPEGFLSSSKTSDNQDGADHLITYAIDGLNTDQPVLALFFEDLAASRADFDYQDLVVEVRGAEVAHAPTPAAFGAGMALLGGVLMRRRRKTAAA